MAEHNLQGYKVVLVYRRLSVTCVQSHFAFKVNLNTLAYSLFTFLPFINVRYISFVNSVFSLSMSMYMPMNFPPPSLSPHDHLGTPVSLCILLLAVYHEVMLNFSNYQSDRFLGRKLFDVVYI